MPTSEAEQRAPTIIWGEPAPWFAAPTAQNPTFHLATLGGRFVVLAFYQSAADPRAAALLKLIAAERARFNDTDVCFFGVTGDPGDIEAGRAKDYIPGIRFFHDFGAEVAALYGAAPTPGETLDRPCWAILDPQLRFWAGGAIDALDGLKAALSAMPPARAHTGGDICAPVLVLPRVFEPEFCKQLIAHYEKDGGAPSGFMREIDGKTRLMHDTNHKRRHDTVLEDEEIVRACTVRIRRRLAPEIAKAFQFKPTRIERHIVSCYDAADEGHFNPHRDNTTKGTAHRRFAVTINLNTGEYQGGDLRFPEFGPRTYRAPLGGAVVFSCSLLHEATLVTKGRRYAYLPFLYDEDAAKLRDANLSSVDLSALTP